MTNVLQHNLEILKALKEQDPEKFEQLLEALRSDGKLFAEIVMPHIMTSSKAFRENPELIEQYIAGTLEREVYMPKYQQKLYEAYDDILLKRKKNAAFILFRGAAKTTIKIINVLRAICFAMDPVIVLISETIDQASRDIITIQDEILNNPIIEFLFGDPSNQIGGSLRGDIWNKQHSTFFNNGYEISLHAAGMGTRIRGIQHKRIRPGLVFVDDFESKTNSNTDKAREETQITISSQIMRITDSEYGMVFQGTIIDPQSFLSKIAGGKIDKFTGEDGIIIQQGISDSPSIKWNSDKGYYESDPYEIFDIGIPVWPSSYPEKWIKEELNYYMQLDGGTGFWQALQEFYNIPQRTTKVIFKTERFTLYEGATLRRYENIHYLEIVKNGLITDKINVHLYAGHDPAAGRNSKNDKTFDAVLARTPEDLWVLVRGFSGQILQEEAAELILRNSRELFIRVYTIETYGYQLSLSNTVKDWAKKENTRININEFNRHMGSKNNKFKVGIAPIVNAGRMLYLSVCEPEAKIIKHEMNNFDDKDINDDSIDGVFNGLMGAEDMPPPPKINIDEKILMLKKLKSPHYQNYNRTKRKAIAV